MEFLNKVQIRGVVGRVSTQQTNGTKITNITVVTEHATRDKSGQSIVDLTWWNITAYGDTAPEGLKRGDWAEVEGRLNNIRYTDEIGNEKTSFRVVASSVKKLEKSATHE